MKIVLLFALLFFLIILFTIAVVIPVVLIFGVAFSSHKSRVTETRESKKDWFDDWHRRWNTLDPSIPGNPGYDDPF